MKLSLLITYRQRENHLKTQINWWRKQAQQGHDRECEVLLIEVDAAPSDWIADAIQDTAIRYIHCACPGVFHKTKALNLGLEIAQGNLITPFDVDLIPVANTLLRHLEIAERSPDLLVTGYRVMSAAATVDIEAIPAAVEQATIAPEDMPTALWKHLVRHEKFGVLPFFERKRLLDIGGWDEHFVGWGAEDQDLIERYLHTGALCRCPELVYLHLFHDRDRQWAEAAVVEQNRSHYYRKAGERQNLHTSH